MKDMLTGAEGQEHWGLEKVKLSLFIHGTKSSRCGPTLPHLPCTPHISAIPLFQKIATLIFAELLLPFGSGSILPNMRVRKVRQTTLGLNCSSWTHPSFSLSLFDLKKFIIIY